MYIKTAFLTTFLLASMVMTTTLYGDGQWFALQEQDNEDIRDYNAIIFVSAREGWVAGVSALEMENPGYIGRTTNGGKTWEKAEIAVNQILSNVFFYDKKHGWAVGANGMIVGTSNGGKQWDIQTSKVDNWLYDIHFVSEEFGYAVGMGETILQTTNGGKIWNILQGGVLPTRIGEEPEGLFNCVQFIDESTGWIAGVFVNPQAGVQNGIVKKTTDGGKTWADQLTNVEDTLKDIFFIDASTGWAVGEGGVVLHTTNGGDRWKIQSSNTQETLSSVQFVDKRMGWAVGGDMGINIVIHTIDGGKTWENQSIEGTMISKIPVNDLFILDANHIWITGNNGFVMKYSE